MAPCVCSPESVLGGNVSSPTDTSGPTFESSRSNRRVAPPGDRYVVPCFSDCAEAARDPSARTAAPSTMAVRIGESMRRHGCIRQNAPPTRELLGLRPAADGFGRPAPRPTVVADGTRLTAWLTIDASPSRQQCLAHV